MPPQRSIDLAREAIQRADSSAEPARVARLYTLLGRNAWAVGDSEVAFDSYRRAIALVPADPPSVELASVLAEEARGLMLMSRFAEAERRCRDAMVVATKVGARSVEGHIRCTLGNCRASIGYHEEGLELLREALVIAQEVANPDDLNRAYTGLSNVLIDVGRLEEGAALAFESAAVGDELWGLKLNGAAGNSVEALIRLGRYDEAEALLVHIDKLGAGSWTCTAQPFLSRASLAVCGGRFDEAGVLLAGVDASTARLSDVQTRAVIYLLYAELALWQGRSDAAYEDVERALAIAAGTDDEMFRPEMYALAARCLADRVDDARALGRRHDLDKARLLALGFVQDFDGLAATAVARGGSCTPRARAFNAMAKAEQSRLHESDPDLWDEAARRWEVAGEPQPIAYCRWREAEALLERRGGRTRADECLQRAWRLSVDLGVLPLQERIELLAQRTRMPLRDVEQGDVEHRSTVADLGLTPREVEVLGQLAAGLTDGEIAERLFISKKTVSVHVSNLLRKLGVANRVEAGKIGQRLA